MEIQLHNELCASIWRVVTTSDDRQQRLLLSSEFRRSHPQTGSNPLPPPLKQSLLSSTLSLSLPPPPFSILSVVALVVATVTVAAQTIDTRAATATLAIEAQAAGAKGFLNVVGVAFPPPRGGD
ncbi:hypothetical protein QYF36_013135 [Acer negundo]|nr:hypothetical protein QYF36_013135 [Acer negundo]